MELGDLLDMQARAEKCDIVPQVTTGATEWRAV